MPKLGGDRDKKDGGDASARDPAGLDAMSMRAKMGARRGAPPSSLFLSLAPPARQGSGVPAAAAAALAAVKAAADRASEVQEKADRAQDMLKAVRERMAALNSQAEQAMVASAAARAAAKQGGATEGAAGALAAGKPAACGAAPAPAAGTAAAAAGSQPVASEAAEGAAAKAAKAAQVAVPAASVAPASAPGAAPQAPAAGTRAEPSAAASRAAGPPLRRGDRVSYVGRAHPGLAAAQERVDQLQAAMSSSRASQSGMRDLLPQLIMRRSMLGAQKERAQRVQPSGAPPIGARGRVLGAAGDKVRGVAQGCCHGMGTEALLSKCFPRSSADPQ